MTFSIAAKLSLVAVMLISTVALVDAQEYRPYVVFSNGLAVSEPEKYSCNDVAWATFKAEVLKLNPAARRTLFSSKSSTSSLVVSSSDTKVVDAIPKATTMSQHRDLQVRDCRNFLVRLANPRCAASPGGRRLTNAIRGMQTTPGCTQNDVAHLNNTINTVVTKMWNEKKIVSNCRNYLTSKREVGCRAVVPCDIKAFHLWDGETDELYKANLNSTGLEICSNMNANIEAETQFAVGKVYFTLTGPLSQTASEAHRPYYLSANDGSNVMGTRYPKGSYTLRAFSDNAPALVKTMTFKVIDC